MIGHECLLYIHKLTELKFSIDKFRVLVAQNEPLETVNFFTVKKELSKLVRNQTAAIIILKKRRKVKPNLLAKFGSLTTRCNADFD